MIYRFKWRVSTYYLRILIFFQLLTTTNTSKAMEVSKITCKKVYHICQSQSKWTEVEEMKVIHIHTQKH